MPADSFKTSTPEEEYFYKQNQELIRKYRSKLNQERQRLQDEQEKGVHWMKCPKCGHNLKEMNMSGVMIDLCGECGGVFLDKGELDLLRKASDHESFFVVLNELVGPHDPAKE